MLEYELLRSSRKSICITVEKDGKVIVRAPNYAKSSEIEAFVVSKQKWINNAITRVNEAIKPPAFKNGAIYSITGENYFVNFFGGARACVFKNIIYFPEREAKKCKNNAAPETFIAIIKNIFLDYAKKRAAVISNYSGINFKSISISLARTRWGSCNLKNEIRLSVFLAFLPCDLIDYVIIHELCHVLQKNHSNKFWLLVRAFLPDYADKIKNLRKYSLFLDI